MTKAARSAELRAKAHYAPIKEGELYSDTLSPL